MYFLVVLIVGLIITTIIICLLNCNQRQMAGIDYSTKPSSKKIDHSIRKVYVPEDHISAESATLTQQEMRRGPKPGPYSKGNGGLIDAFFKQTSYNYAAMEILDRGSAFEVGYDSWGMRIRIRGKNRLGAYAISNVYFVIKNNEIIYSEEVYQ